MKFILPFVLCLSISASHANQIIGSISKIRGTATILELGNLEAKNLVLGQTVSKEASILTSEKSFVQIMLLDKTQINLGPSSKIYLDQTAFEKVGIISLLKGIIRTNVVKESEVKDKLYIKTRTAAMGVRGTDFQTSFNPENKITNLITFRGKVAMIKTESNNLADSLSGKETVFVDSGKFAAISTHLKNATEPVKISPIQYTGFKLNTEMNDEVKVSKQEFQNELKATIQEYSDISKKEKGSENSAVREYDSKKQVLRPTAGGVIDLVTGIYIQPTVNKENFNKDLTLYELKSEKGEVTEAGIYVPPKGIILDATRGFIADSQNETAELSGHLKNLNNDISGQLLKPIKPTKDDLGTKSEDAYDKYFIKE